MCFVNLQVLLVFIFVSCANKLITYSGAARSSAASLSNEQRLSHFKRILQRKQCVSTNSPLVVIVALLLFNPSDVDLGNEWYMLHDRVTKQH